MDLLFTEQQKLQRQVARDFAQKEIAPHAADIDKTGRFPREIFEKMTQLGYCGIGIPEEYGGSGGCEIDKVIVMTEIARACASSAATLSIHGILGSILVLYGTEDQKQKYLPMVAQQARLSAFALTEPGAGSDAASAKTTALLDEATGEYVLNGTKCFITGGSEAEIVAVFALTQPEKGLKGMSCILVERGTPGFSAGTVEEKMGLHGSVTAELLFDNCRVPKENLIGAEGKGFSIAMKALDGARIGIAAQALGIAEEAIDLSANYMKERVQFGKPIAALQGLQWYLAEMATKTEAAKWLIYRAASLKDNGLPYSTEAAMAKLNASENARFVTNLALQIHGGYGYMRDYPLERMYRDAKITEIYEGTSEIAKLVISRSLLK